MLQLTQSNVGKLKINSTKVMNVQSKISTNCANNPNSNANQYDNDNPMQIIYDITNKSNISKNVKIIMKAKETRQKMANLL
jgi:hypothetical protein